MECLHVFPAQQLTLRNSSFRNCAIMDAFFEDYGDEGGLRDITIENNLFDSPGSLAGGISLGYYPLAFKPIDHPISNLRVAYNSLLGTIAFDPGTLTNVVISSNVSPMEQYSCNPQITYTYNVWTNAKCGATDVTAPTGFRDAGALDFFLQSGSAAIDAGDPLAYPAADSRGVVRPVGRGPDAGAFEVG